MKKSSTANIHKHDVAGQKPKAQLLANGDLAFNYGDGSFYYKDASGDVKSLSDSFFADARFCAKDIPERITETRITEEGYLEIKTNYGSTHTTPEKIVGPRGVPGAILRRAVGVSGVVTLSKNKAYVDVPCVGCTADHAVILTAQRTDTTTKNLYAAPADGKFKITADHPPSKALKISYYVPDIGFV